jgi:hypothetical protein
MDRSRTIRHLFGSVYYLAYLQRSATGRIAEERKVQNPKALSRNRGSVLPAFSILTSGFSIPLWDVLNPIAISRAKERRILWHGCREKAGAPGTGLTLDEIELKRSVKAVPERDTRVG